MLTEQQHASFLSRNLGYGPMTETEIKFLKDTRGLIDFALRNGLSFRVVLDILLHDVNEIARFGGDIQAALSRGFAPKMGDFSSYGPDDVGQPDEIEAD